MAAPVVSQLTMRALLAALLFIAACHTSHAADAKKKKKKISWPEGGPNFTTFAKIFPEHEDFDERDTERTRIVFEKLEQLASTGEHGIKRFEIDGKVAAYYVEHIAGEGPVTWDPHKESKFHLKYSYINGRIKHNTWIDETGRANPAPMKDDIENSAFSGLKALQKVMPEGSFYEIYSLPEFSVSDNDDKEWGQGQSLFALCYMQHVNKKPAPMKRVFSKSGPDFKFPSLLPDLAGLDKIKPEDNKLFIDKIDALVDSSNGLINRISNGTFTFGYYMYHEHGDGEDVPTNLDNEVLFEKKEVYCIGNKRRENTFYAKRRTIRTKLSHRGNNHATVLALMNMVEGDMVEVIAVPHWSSSRADQLQFAAVASLIFVRKIEGRTVERRESFDSYAHVLAPPRKSQVRTREL